MNKLQIGKMPQLPFEVSEAINQLRINLSFCGSDVKTIMITSSTPNEGKSFVTMQLWRMIAELGTPAVLIDCDFRKSEMRSKYGMSTSGQLIGGVHYLAGKAELDDVIYETNVPNGYIIPVAKTVTNPAILLESERFAQMIKHCRQRFGVVLIDTPPLGSVADALNIATTATAPFWWCAAMRRPARSWAIRFSSSSAPECPSGRRAEPCRNE